MKRHIPNAITCCNLICGCIAVQQAFAGHTDACFLFIVLFKINRAVRFSLRLFGSLALLVNKGIIFL